MIDLHIERSAIAKSLALFIAVEAAYAAQAPHQDSVLEAMHSTRIMRAESRRHGDGRQAASVSVGSLGATESFIGSGLVEGADTDCQWDDWGEWSVCQFTCGEGVSMRYRKIQKMAEGSGEPCDKDREERNCTRAACPVDCSWNDWADWSDCSATCGSAKRVQLRTAKPAQFGGHACTGSREKSEECTQDECPVNCRWSDWYSWGSCSASCGGGKEERLREIETPSNSAGKPCDGARNETRECGATHCPVDCVMADWGTWELCSVSCGTGTTTRKRGITVQPAYGGEPCSNVTEVHACSPGEACPIDCQWSDWSQWQSCSATCGTSTKKRIRTQQVKANALGTPCADDSEEELPCSVPDCVVDCTLAEWTDWAACSVSCGPGVTERHRSYATVALNGGKDCNPIDLLYEKKYCRLPSCPLDCELFDWSDWSACSATCGGVSTRDRLVKTPAAYGGKECSGVTAQERDCEHAACPIDCTFGDWSAWKACSASCGPGLQQRERVVHREPEHGGLPCTGDLVDSQQCTERPCPVDCSFEEWGDWETCTSSCGAGVHKRTRGTIPATSGGAECTGALTDTIQCPTLPDCPVDCVWEDWTSWTECSVSCGIGAITRMRKRAHYESHGGHVCYGTEDDVAVCELSPCPLDCYLEDWAPWSDCSTTCGEGSHVRSRSLTFAAYGGKECVDPQLQDTKSCEVAPCAVHCELTDWSLWTLCSKTCGGGLSSRSRTEKVSAANGGNPCTGATSQDQACSAQPCPVDCVWGSWSTFNDCTATCGGGSRERHRIMWVVPSNGGAECSGSTTSQEPCNENPCPVDCQWSDWSFFSECSQTCAGGLSSRNRSVATPAAHGGLPCTGSSVQDLPCNTQVCPVSCQWDEWGPWSSCSQTCNGGVTSRQRAVLEAAHDGGIECSGESFQEANCGEENCPVDCVATDWSEWSGCSTSCGGGVNLRFRVIKTQSAYGGIACPSSISESLDCSPEPCPVDCKLGDWREWGSCSTTCGYGTRVRTRMRENERNGGLPCTESLIEEGTCYEAPQQPMCPDLPTLPPSTTAAASAASAAAETAAAETAESAASAKSAAAKTAAVEAAEASGEAPQVVQQVARLAAAGKPAAVKTYLEAAGADPTHFQDVLDNLTTAEEEATVAKAAGAKAKAAVEKVRLRSNSTLKSALGNMTTTTLGPSMENGVANFTAMRGQGPVEVLRLEGNLYLYAPSAESLVNSVKATEGLQLLIAGEAHVEPKNVEVTLSIPKRAMETEFQKKSKGNVRCAYKIHVFSDTGNSLAGDAVMEHLKAADEDAVKKKMAELLEGIEDHSEICPVSMTMKPYRMP